MIPFAVGVTLAPRFECGEGKAQARPNSRVSVDFISLPLGTQNSGLQQPDENSLHSKN